MNTVTSQWLINAIKMTIGIGTPSSKSKMERIVDLPNRFSHHQDALDDNNVIALPASDGGGETCAECTYQQGQKCPEQ
jgi:hypothetical protein